MGRQMARVRLPNGSALIGVGFATLATAFSIRVGFALAMRLEHVSRPVQLRHVAPGAKRTLPVHGGAIAKTAFFAAEWQ